MASPADLSLARLEEKIRAHISSAAWPPGYRTEEDQKIYVVKYMPPKRVEDFHAAGKKLYASAVAGYTWGDGVYVAPLAEPFTTMMYGRAGVVGHIGVSHLYDATQPHGRRLYQAWIRFHWRWYDLLTTTVQANDANRYLRNAFRTRFGIECVLFRPDQFCPGYVGPSSDTWLALSHFRNQRIASGITHVVRDAEWCVTVAEEFSVDSKNLVYDAVLGPAFRGARLGRGQLRAMAGPLSSDIIDCYRRRRANRTVPPLVVHF
jgi:hypothetical protein